ncbi:MAG: hypothetical protein IJL98_02240 [Lachnospiraceae bacterium]|nr:hypothetical protein [Lachnospiraceae bacterium]
MRSIIQAVIENLKKEPEDFYSGFSTIGKVEDFTMSKLKEMALQLTWSDYSSTGILSN